MVQLTEEMVARLDAEAQRRGVSRSAVVREAVTAYLSQDREAELSRLIVEGYTRFPPGVPDEWGDLEAQADRSTRELNRRLEQEEKEAGLEW